MIKLIDAFIVSDNQAELEALQILLLNFSSLFTFSIVNSDVSQSDIFPLKLLVMVGEEAPILDMTFLLSKIDEVNKQFS